jgi:uncharacterized protein YcsI (UPF0317 family)
MFSYNFIYSHFFDLNRPDFGDAVVAEENDVPLFWACGVTSTMAAVGVASGVIAL